jgi:hypothetical protein
MPADPRAHATAAPTLGPSGSVFQDGGAGAHHRVDGFGHSPAEAVNADG